MILVVGETYDSLLGLRSLMKDVEAIPSLTLDLPNMKGRVGGEEVVAITGGTSDYLSLLSTVKAIQTYHPRAVFSIGEATSLSTLLHVGDIIIGNRIFLHGVNFDAYGLAYGVIPGFKPYFYSDLDMARRAEEIGQKISDITVTRGDILSGEKKIIDQEELSAMILRRYASVGRLLAYDCVTAGSAIACANEKIPYLPLRAITYVPTEGEDGLMRERRISLESNVDVAKLLVALVKEGGFGA